MIYRILELHNKEVHEMDDLLEKHLSLAEEDKRQEVCSNTIKYTNLYMRRGCITVFTECKKGAEVVDTLHQLVGTARSCH